MQKYRLTVVTALIVFVLTMLVLSPKTTTPPDSSGPFPNQNSGGTVPDVFTPPATDRSADVAREIADYITLKSEGLLAVPYTEIPDHGNGTFGVHYNAFITKTASEMTGADEARVRELIGEIFGLTTLHILKDSGPSLTHMGVQVIDPDIWWWGGHERGSSRIYIASKNDLLRISAPLGAQWLEAARENPQTLVMTGTLQELLERLQKAEENK
ncbi:MAG: hypothetical protein WD712_03250 [Candidatus Spechtbacterales bacterium]